MNRIAVAGVVAAAGVFAAVYYIAREPATPAAAADIHAPAPGAPQSPPASAPAPATPAASGPAVRPVATDPRLAALMGTPGDDRVELIAGPDGRVIREVDADPNSAGYGKPLREYSYAGERVVALTAYRYLGDHVQIVRAAVTYKADGTVDQYRETTQYDHGKPAR